VKLKYADFWSQYLGADEAAHAEGVSESLRTAMSTEGEQHWEELVWNQSAGFLELATSPVSYGDAALSEIYGTAQATSGRFELPPAERSGFITQPGFLFSPETASVERKVIHRGLVVRERLLCQPPTPPPPGLMAEPEDLRPIGDDATPRESWEAFATSQPACGGCHNGFQPLGLAFESYDNLGRYRDSYEDGRPIVTAGTLDNAGDAAGPYQNVTELAIRIGQSRIGELCFAKQFGQYALGRRLHASHDACTIRALSRAEGGGPLREFITRLSEVEALGAREHY
jgi:hypothetical protein